MAGMQDKATQNAAPTSELAVAKQRTTKVERVPQGTVLGPSANKQAHAEMPSEVLDSPNTVSALRQYALHYRQSAMHKIKSLLFKQQPLSREKGHDSHDA